MKSFFLPLKLLREECLVRRVSRGCRNQYLMENVAAVRAEAERGDRLELGNFTSEDETWKSRLAASGDDI